MARRRGISVNVEGLEELRQRLSSLATEVQRASGDAIQESADAVAQEMRSNVPVDSGDLRSSIRADVDRSGLTAEVGPRGRDVHYGYFVEFGTSSMSAQPYATPAAESERNRFQARLRRHVGSELR